MAINTPTKAYKEMAKKWKLPLALWGGTQRMRDECKEWLPQLPKESDELYKIRVSRSFLFNVYKRTIISMVGNAFTNNVSVSGVPDELGYLEWNADGQGKTLTEFASELFQDRLLFNKAHVYVDFPTTDIQRVSESEYKSLGLRPYFARISPINIIGWEYGYNNGFLNLNHVRITDQDTVVNEDWCEEDREIVRLITPESITTFATPFSGLTISNDDAGWDIIDNVDNALDYIPLQTAGDMYAEPLLEDLAWLNLQHFQSSSDQHNILHIARVPFLLGTGFDEKEVENMTIAANEMVVSSNKDADIKYVEHTGNAINAGRTHGKDLEEQMQRSGADILFSQSIARQTASARKIDQAESLSVAMQLIRSIEQVIEQSYLVAADWLDIEEPFEPEVNIGTDLNLAEEPNPIQGFIQLCQFMGFDAELALEEAKRRGLVAKYLTVNDIELMEQNVEQAEANLTADISATNQPEPEQSREDN